MKQINFLEHNIMLENNI